MTSELMAVSELREETIKIPEESFLLCKKFTPTEGSSKDLTEAVKRLKLVLQLGTPAAVITWLHRTLRAIVAQGVDDGFTKGQAQELAAFWGKRLIMGQPLLSKKTKDKLQAAKNRNHVPPTKVVDMGVRVDGQRAMMHT